MGAVDEVLAVLKMDNLTDNERKVEIEAMLSRLNEVDWNRLIVLARSLKDYRAEKRGAEPSFDQVEMNVIIGDEQDVEVREEQDQEIPGAVRERLDSEEEEERKSDTSEQIIARAEEEQSIDVRDIDAFWLQKKLSEYYEEPRVVVEMEREILKILGEKAQQLHEYENNLAMLFEFEHFDLVKLLLQNKESIYYCVRLAQSQSAEEKAEIQSEMAQADSKSVQRLYRELFGGEMRGEQQQRVLRSGEERVAEGIGHQQQTEDEITKLDKQIIDLEKWKHEGGWHKLSQKKVKLPSQPIYKKMQGYDQVEIAASQPTPLRKDEKLKKVADLPEWIQPTFPFESLNRIQSEVYHTAFETDQNMLICAPTSAGKTNIALLAILHLLGKYRVEDGSALGCHFDVDKFKVVFIAPMKALVAETVGNLRGRFNAVLGGQKLDYGIKVRELTGDMQLSKDQIEETQIIVTTPEKWDIVTRKAGERAFLEKVQLMIIDEVHMLHDERGPVLEALLARVLRQQDQQGEKRIRTVSLSATLPNYKDVAAFLRIKVPSASEEKELINKPQKSPGLFYFDRTYRPVPLKQQYIGINEKKAVKRMMLMNEITYQKVVERASKSQVIVFVHSRKETGRTARAIKEKAINKDELGLIIGGTDGEKYDAEYMQKITKLAKSQELQELLPYGIGIHNAGLNRTDRTLVEDMFSDKKLRVLVSTATLAWGVNLPARTVIIKGTQIYSAEKGRWVELSGQDILQMIGRAGRFGLDPYGEGILITSRASLEFYLTILNSQLPIESQFAKQLADHLNAEIVSGSVANIKEAVNWLQYTYLFIRMLLAPEVYEISEEELAADPLLLEKRASLAHTAAVLLQKANLIKYDKRTGTLQSTLLGRIASHFYVKYDSMQTYNSTLKPTVGIIELFRVFTLSKEFEHIPVREEQKPELQSLLQKVPIPVQGGVEEPTTKINLLLQAFISRYGLESFSLNSDMVYVTQSAGRIFRALFELALHRQYANVAEIVLQACKMVERRMWQSMTPLRQFKITGSGGANEVLKNQDILFRLENKEQFTWQHYRDMTPQQLGELVNSPKNAQLLHRLIHQIPRLAITCFSQTLTRNTLLLQLELEADFKWDRARHSMAEAFWVFVENVDGEQLLHSQYFLLTERAALSGEKQLLSLVVPLFEPTPPSYFLKVISDRWLAAETTLPISFKHIYLPARFPQPTKLLDVQKIPTTELNYQAGEEMFASVLGIQHLNAIQSQCFNALYNWTDSNVFLGAAVNSGKSVCGDLAILAQLQKNVGRKILYICPNSALQQLHLESLTRKYQSMAPVGMLGGEMASDLKVFKSSKIVVTVPQFWDQLSRNYGAAMFQVGLLIVDDFHIMASGNDSATLAQTCGVLEVLVSKMRMFSVSASQTQQTPPYKPCRFVITSAPIANYTDVAEWIGAPKNCTFNFHTSNRPELPLELHIQSSFSQNYRAMRLQSMYKPAYTLIKAQLKQQQNASYSKRAIVFLDDRKNAGLVALELVSLAARDDNLGLFSSESPGEMEQLLSSLGIDHNSNLETTLLHCLKHGVGYLHSSLSTEAQQYVFTLFEQGLLRVITVSAELCWALDNITADLVLLLDPVRFDHNEQRYVTFTTPQLFQMVGRAGRRGMSQTSKAYVFCHTPKKAYFVKVLSEPILLESPLEHVVADAFNAEVAMQNITNTQDAIDWLTWTLVYRRIRQNPNYYNMLSASEEHIKDYLSELVEGAFEDLQNAHCISYDTKTYATTPELLGRIAKQYYVNCSTLARFGSAVETASKTQVMKMRDILTTLASSSQFEIVPVRDSQIATLRMLNELVKYPIKAKQEQEDSKKEVEITDFDTKDKVFLLLQAHFSRLRLPADLAADLAFILTCAVKLMHAFISVLLAFGELSWGLTGIDVCQMLVQGMWADESPLLQLPFFNTKDQDAQNLLDVCVSSGKANIQDIMNMEDEEREQMLKMSEPMLETVAKVCNRYPMVEIRVVAQRSDEKEVVIRVELERDWEPEDDLEVESEEQLGELLGAVYAPFYPKRKEEVWWILAVDSAGKRVLGFKRLTNFVKEKGLELKCESEETKLIVYLLCDSWVGCDQQETVEVA